MGNIGKVKRKIELEPMPRSEPVKEPAPAAEPVAPEPVKEPVPA